MGNSLIEFEIYFKNLRKTKKNKDNQSYKAKKLEKVAEKTEICSFTLFEVNSMI